MSTPASYARINVKNICAFDIFTALRLEFVTITQKSAEFAGIIRTLST